jgi:outer membrane protein assembly factor BamB
VLAACSSGSGRDISVRTSAPPGAGPTGPSPVPPAAPGQAGSWSTYHRSNDRAGVATDVPRPTGLASAWTARLDGQVYGQPIVVGPTVIAATERDTVYGLDLASGRIRWSRHLGTPVELSDLPCGNIDPLGITGSAAYDAPTGSVFVVTETTGAKHDLVSLDVRTGAVRFVRNLDVTSRDPSAEQQRGALAVANGRVYVTFGGLAGDCGNYIGYVAAVAVNGSGPIARYEVPTSRRAGIWAPSGPAVATNGEVYVAVGNGASTGGTYDGSDSVLRLSADLSRRLSYFAPMSWGPDNAEDTDLGSTGPLLLPGGLVMMSGKTGDVYLLDAVNLGGVGGQLASLSGCSGFGGLAYIDGAAFVPCTSGLLRVEVSGRSLRKGWQADASITGSPVVGGGAVWALDTDAGVLHVLDAQSGDELARHDVGDVSRFSSPVLVGGQVIVGTNHGIVALAIR